MRKPQSYLNTVGYTRILLRDEYNIPDSLIPTNDAARLRVLEDYPLLDARSEKILDAVVAATARLFGVSNAMLSIVKKDEVLVKTPYNLPVAIERIPSQQSLCSATILQDETAVFENLIQASAPGVDISLLQQLSLSFYAGHNLRTPDGYNIGSMYLYDGPPRQFAPAAQAMLAFLARSVMHLLEPAPHPGGTRRNHGHTLGTRASGGRDAARPPYRTSRAHRAHQRPRAANGCRGAGGRRYRDYRPVCGRHLKARVGL